MSEEAVDDGDVSGAVQEGQSGIQSTLDRVQS
jgi:hypothetical protein